MSTQGISLQSKTHSLMLFDAISLLIGCFFQPIRHAFIFLYKNDWIALSLF